MEQRINIKFCYKLGKTATETHGMLVQVYGREAVSRKCVYEWFKRFREGKETIEDEPRSGRPSTSRTPEMIAKVRQMLAQDRRLTLRLIAEELDISKDTVHTIVRDDLVVMDAIKKELEVDPLAIQSSDDTATDEKLLPEDGNLLDLHMGGIKTECVDHGCDLTSQIKIEETAVPTNFATIMCKAEDETFGMARVKQENKLDVTTEKSEVLTERILKERVPKEEGTHQKSKRKRCALCPRSKEKKTNQYCVSCDRPVCQDCRSVTCRECGELSRDGCDQEGI
ncbi:protein GVQW3-like isoform X5 [Periplaneta americana]|uniref:protein GVQW3-like isoform X5 n=1 Tax=Periplaneta americana TaxID=6978 RepID=UPI0037E72A5D